MNPWLDRKDVLIKRAKDLRGSLGNTPSTIRPQLDKLLECYIHFIEGHILHLHRIVCDSVYADGDKYPPDYVMHVSLNQAAYDLDIFARLITQRSNLDPNADILLKADFLAVEALEPARSLLTYPKKTTIKNVEHTHIHQFPSVLTYFHKSPLIRLIPYANMALIGIPFTSVMCSRDLLAIPHEVGHYVFWHGKDIRDQSLVDDAPENPIFYGVTEKVNKGTKTDIGIIKETALYNWQEEIFADVYGSQIAGPLIALDFQDYQLRNAPEDFKKDDGEHPTPAYRPNIYANGLEGEWKEKLNSWWNEKLTDRKFSDTQISVEINPEKFLLKTLKDENEREGIVTRIKGINPDKNSFTNEELNERLDDLVTNSINKNHLSEISGKIGSTFWGKVIKTIKEVYSPSDNALADITQEILYGILQKIVFPNEPSNTGVINAQVMAELQEELRNGVETYHKNRPSITEKEYEFLKNEWIDKWAPTGDLLGWPDWYPVFKADGWTTEGVSNPWST